MSYTEYPFRVKTDSANMEEKAGFCLKHVGPYHGGSKWFRGLSNDVEVFTQSEGWSARTIRKNWVFYFKTKEAAFKFQLAHGTNGWKKQEVTVDES